MYMYAGMGLTHDVHESYTEMEKRNLYFTDRIVHTYTRTDVTGQWALKSDYNIIISCV